MLMVVGSNPTGRNTDKKQEVYFMSNLQGFVLLLLKALNCVTLYLCASPTTIGLFCSLLALPCCVLGNLNLQTKFVGQGLEVVESF